jgi:hypothetical protein
VNLLVTWAVAFVLASWGATDADPEASGRPWTAGSAVVGVLAADGRAEGALTATSDGFAFHAFVVDLPPDVVSWTLELHADADLDLALRFGAMLRGGPPGGLRGAAGRASDAPPGGDWDRFDIGSANPTVLTLERPRPGRWFVVVVAPLEPGAGGRYVLESWTERSASSEAGVTGTFRCRDSDALLRLRVADDGRLVGTLEGPSGRYDVDAIERDGGAYGVIWNATGWIGFLALPTPSGLAVVLFELDDESHAIEESAWWMRFDRIGASPGP